jgi:hypothetical protein
VRMTCICAPARGSQYDHTIFVLFYLSSSISKKKQMEHIYLYAPI